jgi:hypothetical protein
MRHVCREVISSCETCIGDSIHRVKQARAGLCRHSDSGVTQVFQRLAIDFFTPPQGRNKPFPVLLVGICEFSRFVLLTPLSNKKTKTVSERLRLWADLYPIQSVKSDNEPVLHSASKHVPLKWRFVAPFAPQSNGIVERRMSQIRQFIQCHRDWYTRISQLAKTINSTPTDTDYTPAEIVFGVDFGGNSCAPNIRKDLQLIREEVNALREDRPALGAPMLNDRHVPGSNCIKIHGKERERCCIVQTTADPDRFLVENTAGKLSVEHRKNLAVI